MLQGDYEVEVTFLNSHDLFRVKIKSHKVLAYRTESLDQFPMKSGILPVSSVSEAHLRTHKFFPVNCIKETMQNLNKSISLQFSDRTKE